MLTRPRQLACVGPLLALVLVAACAPGSSPAASPSLAPTGLATATPGTEPTPPATPAGTPPSSPGPAATVRAYFMLGSFTGDGGLAPVLRDAPGAVTPEAAIAQLLAGPQGAELAARPAMYSEIPAGTTLVRISLTGGVATVDLSAAFAAGAGGATRAQRFGQVVYTLTQFPTTTSVAFEVAGKATDVVIDTTDGGVTTVRRAVARQDYTGLLPAIWVDQPAWGGSLPSGAHVTGLANAFEARFQLQVLDAAGTVLADLPVMATCGTGCWGTFDTTVTYAVSAAQPGTLRVFEASAADGSPVHVVDYPVLLAP